MKKVLVLTTTFPRWPKDTVPPFIFELERRLAKKFKIYLIAPHYWGAKNSEIMAGLIVRRIKYFWPLKWQRLCYGGGMFPNLKSNPWLGFQIVPLMCIKFFTMWQLIRERQIRVVHAHWFATGGLLAVIYKQFIDSNIHVIITDHTSRGPYLLSLPLIGSLYRWTIKNCDTFIAVSSAYQHLYSPYRTNILRMPMGVDSELFKPGKPDREILRKYGKDIVLFVGRLVEEKGVDVLIRVAARIVKEKPSVTFVLVGSGTLENKLKSQVIALRLNKNIQFIGALPNQDLVRYYQSARIFFGPSRSESFGLVFVEAMMSGCAIVGSNLESISDIIINNKTGFSFTTDDIGGYSRKILDILDNPKKYQRLKKVGRRHAVENFSWKVICHQYREAYDNSFKKISV